MKWFCVFCLTLGLSSVARAADISSMTVQGEVADWSLIQAAGGIEIGPAIQTSSSAWKVALTCDLSAHTSGNIIRNTLITQEDNSIYISLVIGHTVWTLTPERSQCRAVVIDSKPGVHLVFYRDAAGKTYPLGHVEFNLDSNVLNSPPG